ncbi:s-formylglutathione hydrolase-like protein [Umbelopsis sp. PMI_123]|nr:s-formylglutathione hydrolase-like protein [Umbelopsis sp. PMI_123]
MTLKEISRNRAFNGYLVKYEHESQELGCTMKFNVFLPENVSQGKVPGLYYLAGLTCNEDNFVQKSGALKEAAKHGIALIAPDTSPRGVKVEGDDDSWDFGTGAGFYVDATEDKWKKHYRMYSYIVKELPAIVHKSLPIDENRISIFGHSMGGHGALTIFLKNPSQYKSVSAFSPIANPINCPWGHKAFGGYLGNDNKDQWKQYDACELLKSFNGKTLDILVDVGTSDNFLEEQLKLDQLKDTAASIGRQDQVNVRYQEGYDHSYYFISTFISSHIEHHAKYLNA